MKESYKQKKDWESELKEMLENAGLKPIQFKMNNGGAKILVRVSSLIDETEKEASMMNAESLNRALDEERQRAQVEMREEMVKWIQENKQLTDTSTTYQYAVSYESLISYLNKSK